ncbi:MAG: oligosaccharide flippase family protein [Aridibacter famidurans]|nr:oligosaccharide flippase family protein [Aridibacter famidurans]
MSEPTSLSSPTVEGDIPTTRGLTTKVVKGSMWTLAGQIAPLAISLVTTPITIRLLGAEGYGVLILVTLTFTYLGFADFGMAVASTKFGAEAYGEGSPDREGRIIRTAALIASVFTIAIAIPCLLLTEEIIGIFSVPAHYFGDAVFGFRIAVLTFILNVFAGVLNTPQLARLRFDLNTAINATTRILGIIATPIVIWMGYGITGVLAALFCASLLNLTAHLIVSRSLLKSLFETTIERSLVGALLRYGGGLSLAGVAAVLLGNLEKAVLASSNSVKALAYYSVAFTLASMAMLATQSLRQTLVPAFAQLIGKNDFSHLISLFLRSLRLNLLFLLPGLVTLVIIARPLITMWAGEDFGRESTNPFYFLLIGLLFNILAAIPHAALLAAGKTGALAKIYWMEVFPYVAILFYLTNTYGTEGAAVAWSIRAVADSVLIAMLSKKYLGTPFGFFKGRSIPFLVAAAVILVPGIISIFLHGFRFWLLIILAITIPIYLLVVCRYLLDQVEIEWIERVFRRLGMRVTISGQ